MLQRTCAGIWKLMGKRWPAPPPTPKDYIIAKLGLDADQQEQFEALREEHFNVARQIQANIRNEKDAMYDLLKSPSPDTTVTYQHIAKIMQNEERLERITFEHFRQVRAICTPEQQQHFDVIIDKLMQMVMRPHPPGQPHGPMEHDGPPPPLP